MPMGFGAVRAAAVQLPFAILIFCVRDHLIMPAKGDLGAYIPSGCEMIVTQHWFFHCGLENLQGCRGHSLSRQHFPVCDCS